MGTSSFSKIQVLSQSMTLFSLSCDKLGKAEDRATINDVMEAWEGEQVAETVWILKRNDGCTCQTIVDDLMEHLSTDNEISVVEIKRKSILTSMSKYVKINGKVC